MNRETSEHSATGSGVALVLLSQCYTHTPLFMKYEVHLNLIFTMTIKNLKTDCKTNSWILVIIITAHCPLLNIIFRTCFIYTKLLSKTNLNIVLLNK